MLLLSSQPATLNGDGCVCFGGNTVSIVSLSASSSILGRRVLSNWLLSSRHGLVLTSISHGFSYASIMKS